MKRLRQRPLTRELMWVIAVKVVLIVTIKLVFFSDAVKPDSDEVARALLTQPSPAQRSSNP
jgi:nitric oxide reductase large subunit